MNEKQRKAYEWAKNQQYNSVAADYARELAGLVDSLTEENKALRYGGKRNEKPRSNVIR